ncbi:iron-containing redox enzyme family protein [Streptomyces lydicus]|uniref:iron-containing redox enzyme family protein n=1 Tax=Streptomyces lydicus TaxID=47763 RepID=UPI002E33E648|nr:iron-containing redox enzyme family protein [Streptomyces lydicus]
MKASVGAVRPGSPQLPRARGHLSGTVISWLRTGEGPLPTREDVQRHGPYEADLQLALYVLYELHYEGFDGVDDDREWAPALLSARRYLEEAFLGALRSDVPALGAKEAMPDLLTEPAADDGSSVSHYLKREGRLWQVREYAALRSLYHLKEADPHAWVLPRLRGRAKAGMAAIEFDEFGAGRAEGIHAQLFADLMADLALETAYGHYLDLAPAETLAVVNLMSLLGLHRSLRGALIGHFATVEVTSSPGSRRLAEAMRRTGAGPAAERFYDEHVEADAVHEQVVRTEVVEGLLKDEPGLEPDVAFGIGATTLLERRLAKFLLASWREGRSALPAPLPQVRAREPARNET